LQPLLCWLAMLNPGCLTRVFQSGTVSYLVSSSASRTVLTRLSLAQSVPKVVPNADRHPHPPIAPWNLPLTQKREQAAQRQKSNALPHRHCPLHQRTKPDRRTVVPTLLIDYCAIAITFYQSIYCFLIRGFSCLISPWGCGPVGTTAAAASPSP